MKLQRSRHEPLAALWHQHCSHSMGWRHEDLVLAVVEEQRLSGLAPPSKS